MADFDLGSYKTVAQRIAEFGEQYPDGCLRPVDASKPFDVIVLDGQTWIVYAAAAYRSADDALPGIGVAWERYPGKTPYTRDSELQNAETSAWGRAIVAVLASDTRQGIASHEDVRNRRDDYDAPPPGPSDPMSDEQRAQLNRRMSDLDGPARDRVAAALNEAVAAGLLPPRDQLGASHVQRLVVIIDEAAAVPTVSIEGLAAELAEHFGAITVADVDDTQGRLSSPTDAPGSSESALHGEVAQSSQVSESEQRAAIVKREGDVVAWVEALDLDKVREMLDSVGANSKGSAAVIRVRLIREILAGHVSMP